ncbi:MAG: DnaJ domain-containing protein [Fischerella sp.]|uniref:DnaJ domain-containing protein n=1 Tax=Fischerella sp. TaxID=1191 RepID=UPI0017B9B537|nr:DnaJ domain-containing protein [Fischerella sp.]NWF58983.1 DnaJ domain-containing protein [Fischerella sp.]
MNDQIEAYPLTWPVTSPRTLESKRKEAKFEVGFSVARDHLLNELRLLEAKNVIISSNVPLRKDGLPYANFREPADPGVAVYFNLKKKSYVLACDQWSRVKDNLRAIGLHVNALRGMERWGVGSIEQAFMGYQALPQAQKSDEVVEKSWWIVLGVNRSASPTHIKEAYRQLAKIHHPDSQGSDEKMAEINRAYQQAKQERHHMGFN